jgi:hypothetical protein
MIKSKNASTAAAVSETTSTRRGEGDRGCARRVTRAVSAVDDGELAAA